MWLSMAASTVAALGVLAALLLPVKPFSAAERRIINQSGNVMYVTVMPQDSAVLRAVSVDLSARELRSQELKTLAAKMLSTVQDPSQDGVGIAAPQVGINKRIVCVQRFDKPGEPFEAYYNIHIDTLMGPLKSGREGCLSIPGEYYETIRPAKVKVKAQDRFGEWHEYEGEELKAR